MENNKLKKTLSLQAAYDFGIDQGLEEQIKNIKEMEIEWDSSYTSSLRRGYIVDLFERENIFQSFKDQYWQYGNLPEGDTLRKRYLRIKSDYEAFLSGDTDTDDSPTEEEISDQAFAAESDLRDFLAENLSIIEEGLTLVDHDGRNGIEYPVEGGRIDILAIDKNGKFVVIELKLSRGREKALGQILYYLGWVDNNLGNSPCRGVIIARDIPQSLILAASRVEGILLFEYQLSVSLRLITKDFG